MEKMLTSLGIHGLSALVVVLAVVIVILAVVIICLSMQINKMIGENEKLERKYERRVSVVRESLDDCKAQNRELQRQKEEAEENARNYKAQRDFALSSKREKDDTPAE